MCRNMGPKSEPSGFWENLFRENIFREITHWDNLFVETTVILQTCVGNIPCREDALVGEPDFVFLSFVNLLQLGWLLCRQALPP